MLLVPHGPTLAPGHSTAIIADKIEHMHFQKESKFHLLPTISVQPVFRSVSTSCHAVRALAGYPRCVRVGNDYDKMRLYTPIRLKTTALPRCACHHSVQRGCSSSPRRGDESAGKRSHRNRSSSPERVGLLQPLL